MTRGQDHPKVGTGRRRHRASAAKPTTKANTDTFSTTRYYVFAENGVCVKDVVDGRITYTAVKGPREIGSSLRTYYLKNITLRSPRVRATLVRYDSVKNACTSTSARFKKLKLRQAWAGYSCSDNPKFSVGVPFAVSTSDVWPGCRKRTAAWSASFTNGTRATQLNTDARVNLATYTYTQRSSNPKTGPCYGGRLGITVQTGSIDNPKRTPPGEGLPVTVLRMS